MTDRFEWVATRGDKADVIGGQLPPLPVRLLLLVAYYKAEGYDEVDVDDGQGGVRTEQRLVREPDQGDLQAILYAALASCWTDLHVSPTLRECGRDPVEWGEHAMTALYDAGYRDWKQLITAAHQCIDAMQATVVQTRETEAQIVEGFGAAQERG